MSEPVIQKRLSIQVLSPLHIGDGGRLRRKQFARSGNQVVIAEEARLLARVQTSPRLLDSFLQFCQNPNQSLEEFLRDYRIQPAEVGYALRAQGAVGVEVYTFVKGADGRPYLPGSSLKGALRSALLRASLLADPERLRAANALVREHLRKRDRAGRISGDLEKRVFGQDQHHDWMRLFQFGDSAPVERTRLQVAEVKVLSVSGASLAEKQTRAGRDMLLNPEVLTVGALEGTLTINAHLLDASGPARRLGFAPHEQTVNDFQRACNRAASALLEGEIAFYERYGETGLADWHRRLRTQLDQLGPNECLMQLAWGSGFTPKTATSLLEERIFEDVRWAFNLGKFARGTDGKRQLVRPFPKSRKVVYRNHEPAEPLGWIKLAVENE
jgi:CRISPR-associated protein Csm5